MNMTNPDSENWIATALTLTDSLAGMRCVSLSALAVFRLVYNHLYDSGVNDPQCAIRDVFDVQTNWLLSMRQTLNIIKPKIQENIDRLDIEDLEAVEAFNKQLFSQLFTPFGQEAFSESMQRARARLVINELDNSFFHGKSCIDAGCGAGRFASVMGELGADVVGFDCCEESIACAQAHASSLGLDTVQFKTANLYELPLPDNSVDFAVSNGVLHHHTNFDKAIRELHRVLKQGGLLWVYTVGTCDGLESQTDESIKRAMLRVPVATTLSLLQELETPPNTYLSATDTMYAVYYYRSFDETKRKLEELEFEAIEPLRLHHEYDQNDILPNHVKRFGSGTIRLLASKK